MLHRVLHSHTRAMNLSLGWVQMSMGAPPLKPSRIVGGATSKRSGRATTSTCLRQATTSMHPGRPGTTARAPASCLVQASRCICAKRVWLAESWRQLHFSHVWLGCNASGQLANCMCRAGPPA